MAGSSPWGKEFDDLCLAMGRALATWQHVEAGCFELFYTLMKSSEIRLCSLVFYSIDSFDARRKIIDRLFPAAIADTKARTEWNDLNSRLKKANEDRNKIAHYSIEFEAVQRRNLPDGETEVVFSAPRLQSSPANFVNKLWGRSPDNPDHNLTYQDVTGYMADFILLASAVMGLISRLTPPPKPTLAQVLGLHPVFPDGSNPSLEKSPVDG